MDNHNSTPTEQVRSEDDQQPLEEQGTRTENSSREAQEGQPQNSNESTDTGPELSNLTEDLTTESSRDELNLFERFMDVFTGNRPSSESSSSGTTTGNTSSLPGATAAATSADTSHAGGAIIITVSYVFSDENNPSSPNRSGSLVMSLPNTPANRDPSTIQEIISLATQMAYSTIVSGIKKSQGTTMEKFNSFPTKSIDSLIDSKSCSICFEDYTEGIEKSSTGETEDVDYDKDEEVSHADGPRRKKRRVTVNNVETTGGIHSDHTSTDQLPKYVSEFTGSFTHCPVEMPCGHIFGKSCLCEWLKDHATCPLCRDSVAEQPVGQPLVRDVPSITTNASQTFTNLLNFRHPNRTRTEGTEDATGASPPNPANGAGPRGTTAGLRARNSFAAYNSLNRIDHAGPMRHTPPQQATGATTGTGIRRSDEGVLSQLFAFLRRPPASHEGLFPSGVSSRRSANGVITRQTNERDTNEIIDYLNLRSLTDDQTTTTTTTTETQSTNNDIPNDDRSSDSNTNHENDSGSRSVNGDRDGVHGDSGN
ncbi:hypothetical protein CLIB1423_07S02366 [[Candida] railenensis]|uniref:RING-type domain-containing protein n=1 Tax=[Candida] railenensis TaxID=45579 RepID=A0A9P0QPN3_9ASCO|nr:hypothetical protein CLIB1423_07S02366 [[Candida] railenensis]